MNDNLPTETVPPTISGPDAPRFGPVSPGVIVDLALIESLNLSNAEEQAAIAAKAAEKIADAEARAAKLIAAAVADAEEQVAHIRPRAEADAEKIVQQARDEAIEIEDTARETATGIVGEAEKQLAEADTEAAAILAKAEDQADELRRSLEIDRELAREKLETLEGRESEIETKLGEAEEALKRARAEAERIMDEAGEAVDRMMRSGHVAAEAQRDAYESDQDAINVLQTKHASELRELTERFEAKVSNQNIENLELRQEIESLTEALTQLQVAVPTTQKATSTSRASASRPPRDEPRSVDAPPADDGFVSQWMVPEVEEHETPVPIVEPGSDADEDQDEDVTEDEDSSSASDAEAPSVGMATGLKPNTRLVEPLSAAAFRPAQDPKKRRRRKR